MALLDLTPPGLPQTFSSGQKKKNLQGTLSEVQQNEVCLCVDRWLDGCCCQLVPLEADSVIEVGMQRFLWGRKGEQRATVLGSEKLSCSAPPTRASSSGARVALQNCSESG